MGKRGAVKKTVRFIVAAIMLAVVLHPVLPVHAEGSEEDQANSWRYENGQLKEDSSNVIRTSSYHPNATRTGIDVSEWNGVIDWEKVKGSGVDYAIIRCGWGMDEKSQDDKYWLRNVSECERLGIPYGVYLYSYATNTERAMSEAKHVLRLIDGYHPTYPIYYDMEDSSTLGSDLPAIAKTFCDTITASGYPVGIYANLNWWNNYLTDECFSQWYKWVAQYNSSCNYGNKYEMWQYTSSGSVPGITGRVDLNYLIGYPEDHGQTLAAGVPEGYKDKLTYSAHVQDYGWLFGSKNGQVAGTVGINKKLEAIRIDLQSVDGVSVEYQSHVEDYGWMDFVSNGQISGTSGENKRLEAVWIKLSGTNADKYDIYYRTHVSDFGWMDWAKNGQSAGSEGYGKQIEAIQVVFQPKGEDAPGDTEEPFRYNLSNVALRYQAHVQDIGWQVPVGNGEVAGTEGRALRVEAFTMESDIEGLEVSYASSVQDIGWQSFQKEGAVSGTVGMAKQVEAVKIQLSGKNKDNYEIFYRVHVSGLGWLGWAKDGQEAGTQGYHYQLEAIQIMLLPADSSYAPEVGNSFRSESTEIAYQAHVREIGWQNAVMNGTEAGTTGRALSIEALAIALKNQGYSGDLSYQAHVSELGWQDWKQGGQICGTTGRALAMEAIKIDLTDDMKLNYDVYYRVHARAFGWLGWAKNGEMAGTQGCAKPMEAVQIKLVKKGQVFGEYDSAKKAYIIN